jgi:hypothetical protein
MPGESHEADHQSHRYRRCTPRVYQRIRRYHQRPTRHRVRADGRRPRTRRYHHSRQCRIRGRPSSSVARCQRAGRTGQCGGRCLLHPLQRSGIVVSAGRRNSHDPPLYQRTARHLHKGRPDHRLRCRSLCPDAGSSRDRSVWWRGHRHSPGLSRRTQLCPSQYRSSCGGQSARPALSAVPQLPGRRCRWSTYLGFRHDQPTQALVGIRRRGTRVTARLLPSSGPAHPLDQTSGQINPWAAPCISAARPAFAGKRTFS